MGENRELSFNSILFATDFSTSVRAAGRYAALLAQRWGAELIVVHAFTLSQPALEAETLGHVRSTQREHLERLLSEAVKELTPLARKSASVLREGTPLDVIRAVSEQHKPSMIVLGTHGGGAMERHLIGSVAEGVLRTIPGPILTVGPHVAVPSDDGLAFRHILYATGFSAAETHVASYAFALSRAFGAYIDLLHVVSEEAMSQHDRTQKEKDSHAALDQLVSEQARMQCRPESFVEFGSIPERIVERARERRADLIVLGAHHHSRLAMHMRTGPAFQVIVAASCPVLTICY